jgi:hypothetical protein
MSNCAIIKIKNKTMEEIKEEGIEGVEATTPAESEGADDSSELEVAPEATPEVVPASEPAL